LERIKQISKISSEAQINQYFKKSSVVEPVETRGLLEIFQNLKYLKTYASVLIFPDLIHGMIK
jgi:hypothetical protein